MGNVHFLLLMLAALLLTGVSALAQYKYYARTVRRLAAAHDDPGCVLVSGRGKSRFRGAITVLVLTRQDQRIRAASVMEGASVFARFKDRPDWEGLPARGELPDCSGRVSAAVADACSRVPGLRVVDHSRSEPLVQREAAVRPRRPAPPGP